MYVDEVKFTEDTFLRDNLNATINIIVDHSELRDRTQSKEYIDNLVKEFNLISYKHHWNSSNCSWFDSIELYVVLPKDRKDVIKQIVDKVTIIDKVTCKLSGTDHEGDDLSDVIYHVD